MMVIAAEFATFSTDETGQYKVMTRKRNKLIIEIGNERPQTKRRCDLVNSQC